jgi:hypothetical protein
MLSAVLISCLISELQKSPLQGLEPRTDFRNYGLCSRNLVAETNTFGVGTVLLSCLVSELQEPSSLGLEPRNYPDLGFRDILKSFQGQNA